MARQATQIEELTTVEEAAEEISNLPAAEEVVSITVVTPQPSTKSVRVKGTWTMFWGSSMWDFVDGNRYDLPWDLFEYLKSHGNIYDTM